jgi:outer membrane protein assembly factor BamA
MTAFRMGFLYLILALQIIPAFAYQSLGKPDTNQVKLDSLYRVDTVMVIGNDRTKEFVILREMSLKPGKLVTKEMIAYDQNRIYSLGLFNRVIIHVAPATEETADLVVEVSERWYIFPFPIFGIRDHDWKKVYFGGGLLHSNFRGRNEKLYGTIVFGYDPSFAISYRNPFLASDGSYQLDTRFAFDKIRNRSISAQAGGDNFDEKHVSLMFSLGRRFGINHSLWVTAGCEMVKISSYQPGRTISPDGEDIYPYGAVSYTYDTRDLYEYPMMGSFIRLGVKKYGFPGNDIDIVRYVTDFRHYQPVVSSLILTGRLFTDWAAAGRTPSNNRVYLGYTERIRGHFREVREGENLFGISTELRYPLYGPEYYTVDYLPAEFRILKFGVVAALFADAGTVWFRGKPFALNTLTKGYGAGIHFLLPYSIVFRVDYAWNEVRRGEFILDLGTSF